MIPSISICHRIQLLPLLLHVGAQNILETCLIDLETVFSFNCILCATTFRRHIWPLTRIQLKLSGKFKRPISILYYHFHFVTSLELFPIIMLTSLSILPVNFSLWSIRKKNKNAKPSFSLSAELGNSEEANEYLKMQFHIKKKTCNCWVTMPPFGGN